MDSNTPDNNITIGFQIKEIRVGSFTINENLVDERNEVNFGINLQHLFNPDSDEHIVQLELEATYGPGQPPLVVLHTNCHYQLTGYRDWLKSVPDAIHTPGTLPTGLALTLNSISLSTTRGILFERLRGTTLQALVLPIIDPSAFQPVN